jgi:hypothetical protein
MFDVEVFLVSPERHMFFLDRKNEPFEVRPGCESDFSGLLEMYETFQLMGGDGNRC